MNEELKPCPFCGGEAKMAYVKTNPEAHLIYCNDCNMMVMLLKEDSRAPFPTDEMFISVWNSRR